MFCRQPVWRRARRASTLLTMTTLLFVAPVLAAVAAGDPDTGAADSVAAVRTTVLGMPVVTGLWALFGVLALLSGLIVASRGARGARRSAQLVGLDARTDALGAGIIRADGSSVPVRTAPAV